MCLYENRSGGVCGYFGAKLAKAGNDLTFVARGKHLQALKNNGLQVKSILGDFAVEQVKATDKIAEIDKSDLIKLGVKAWQIAKIRFELKEILHPNSVTLPPKWRSSCR